MFYKIREVATCDCPEPHTWVLVEFWANRGAFQRGDPPAFDNDFHMQLRSIGERIVEDAQGRHKLLDGTFLPPLPEEASEEQALAQEQRIVAAGGFERETFDRDVPADVRANVEAYLKRRLAAEQVGRPFPARHANLATGRSQADPHGILSRPDVQALRGREVELLP